MLRLLALVIVLGLFLARLLRGRFGARLLGVSERALDIAYIVALVLAGMLAVATEYWPLLIVVVLLLALRGLEALRTRRD